MSIESKQRERKEERRDNKAEATIIEKSTDKVVDRATLTYDEAERWARNKIDGRPELKYRIYHVGTVDR